METPEIGVEWYNCGGIGAEGSSGRETGGEEDGGEVKKSEVVWTVGKGSSGFSQSRGRDWSTDGR